MTGGDGGVGHNSLVVSADSHFFCEDLEKSRYKEGSGHLALAEVSDEG